MIDVLDDQQIENLLKQQYIGRIGCHADGITYIVPISYAYDGEAIYVHTTEGKKMEMLRKNPEVCFEVDTMNVMTSWSSVIAWGTFEEIKDAAERSKALKVLLNRALPLNSPATTRLGNLWPFSSSDLSDIDGIVFKIVLKEKNGRFENNTAAVTYPA